MISISQIQCKKIIFSIQFGEDVLDSWHGPSKFPSDLIQSLIIDNQSLSSTPLGMTIIGADQLD